MNSTVRDCLVEGYEKFIESVQLPDKNDRHILAAAIHCNADIIVTFNLKDFPIKVLREYKMRALHPDDFILSLLNFDPLIIYRAAQQHRARLNNPKKAPEEYLFTLPSLNIASRKNYLHLRYCVGIIPLLQRRSG